MFGMFDMYTSQLPTSNFSIPFYLSMFLETKSKLSLKFPYHEIN